MSPISLVHCVMSASVFIKIETAGKCTITSKTILPRLFSHPASLLFTLPTLFFCFVSSVLFDPPPPLFSHAHTRLHISHSQFSCICVASILVFLCSARTVCVCMYFMVLDVHV